MNSEKFSQAMGEVDSRYVEEAIRYEKKAGKRVRIKYTAAAAGLAVVFVLAGLLFPLRADMVVSAYAQDTHEEITAAGVTLMTGSINDSGEMKGPPLMFYLSGKDIATVRFSCKNQQINFMDWTEKRDEYGNAQNFTVSYGEDESEYYYLTINWVPDRIIRQLTGHRDSAIASLPDEMRSDLIVMEITFTNGKTATKALSISLLDDGTFFASFDDYTVGEDDAFVKRPDSEAIPRAVLYSQGTETVADREEAGAAAAPEETGESAPPVPVEQTKWGVTLSIRNVTSTGLILVCTQSGGMPTGQLQTGSYYKLLVFTDEGWQDIPGQIMEAVWSAEPIPIPMEDEVEWEIRWKSLYGELPPGTYRIVKQIDDFRNTGDYDTEECWAEFEIR